MKKILNLKQNMRDILQKIGILSALLFILLGSFGIGFVGVMYPHLMVYAQPYPPHVGGIIGTVLPCLCSAGYIDYVGPPRPGAVYVQEPISIQFEWYQSARPGPWTLANYLPDGGHCMVVSPHSGCNSVPALGTVTIQGTSM